MPRPYHNSVLMLFSPPQPIRSLTVLPHLNRPILASSRVQLSIRGKADAPDRTMMALVNIYRKISQDQQEFEITYRALALCHNCKL
jgi:hypothetical protein